MEKTNFYRKINKMNDSFTNHIRYQLLSRYNVYRLFSPNRFQSYAFNLFWCDDNDFLCGDHFKNSKLHFNSIRSVILEFCKIFKPEEIHQFEYDLKFYGQGHKTMTRFARIVYQSMIYIDGTTLVKLNKIVDIPFDIAISKLKRNKLVNEGILLKLSIKQSGMF